MQAESAGASPQCLPPLADIESLLACLTRDEADA